MPRVPGQHNASRDAAHEQSACADETALSATPAPGNLQGDLAVVPPIAGARMKPSRRKPPTREVSNTVSAPPPADIAATVA